MSDKLSQVRVWLVREGVEVTATGICGPRDLFILATSLTEALEVVGTAPGREVVLAQEVCPITLMESNKWRIVPREQPKP